MHSVCADTKQSAEYVFTHYEPATGTGVNNKFYVFLVGLLMSQFTLLAYDVSPAALPSLSYVGNAFDVSVGKKTIGADGPLSFCLSVLWPPVLPFSAQQHLSNLSSVVFQAATHLTEETVGADWTAPVMIVSAVGSAAVVGWAYLLVLTFCIQVSPPKSFGATGFLAGFVP
jgi:hypothetical protein